MKDDNQPNSGESPTETGKGFASRRKVVKGLATAVPVVMTMGSGAGAAAASSVQCLTHANTPAARPQECLLPGEREATRYARRAIDSYIDVDTVTGERLTPEQVMLYNNAPAPALASPSSSFARGEGPRGLQLDSASTDSRIAQVETKKFCLVYVNQNGERVGPRDGGFPVTASCLASVIANRG